MTVAAAGYLPTAPTPFGGTRPIASIAVTSGGCGRPIWLLTAPVCSKVLGVDAPIRLPREPASEVAKLASPLRRLDPNPDPALRWTHSSAITVAAPIWGHQRAPRRWLIGLPEDRTYCKVAIISDHPPLDLSQFKRGQPHRDIAV